MKELKSKVEYITPQKASEMLEKNGLNRPISKETVDYYAKEMLVGEWRLNGESIVLSDNGILLDGQHRLSAVVSAGTTVPMLVVRGVPENFFPTFDDGKSRCVSDAFNIADVKDYPNVASMMSKYCALRGSNSAKDGKGNSGESIQRRMKVSKSRLLELYSNDTNDILTVLSFSKKCYSKMRIMSVGEMSAYVYYLWKDKQHSFDSISKFFSMLTGMEPCDDINIDNLRGRMVNNKINTTHLSPVVLQQMIIKTWNNYFTHKTSKVLKWNPKVESRQEFV